MTACAALRGGSAICTRELLRIAPQQRSCISQLPGSGDHPRVAAAATQDPTAGSQPKDAHVLRIDQDDKVVKTAAGDLPLSPLMDPSFWEARDRCKRKKPNARRPQNVFERQFRKNPFAQALATPVRIDAVTKLRMPSFFLQDFNIIAHPVTGAPWWVPRSLALQPPPDTDGMEEANDREIDPETAGLASSQQEAIVSDGVDMQSAATPEATLATTPTADTHTTQRAPEQNGHARVLGPSAYILARQSLLRSFREAPKGEKGKGAGMKSTGNSEYHRRLLGPSSSNFKVLGAQAVWREDMDEFVLHQMRELIVRDILYLARLCESESRYYIVRCWGWEDIKFKHKGAVLWFGAEDGRGEADPGLLATYEIDSDRTGRTSVVIHNMSMLLGNDLAEKVRTEAAILSDGSLFMLAGRRTTGLQLRLWKLQGYLYDPTRPT